jgi:hypothetical protein
LAIWLMAVWLGGFTFYSAVVIPVLHDQLGSPLETGLITQRVTDALNLLGVATVTLGGLAAGFERSSPGPGSFRSRAAMGLLALTTLCLAALILLHRALDRRLDSAELGGFYPLHRAYLWVSTVQWLTNMGSLAWWAGCLRGGGPEGRGEKPQVLKRPGDPE